MEVVHVVPVTTDEWNWIWLGLGLMAAGSGGLFVSARLQGRGRKHTEKVLIQMLLFFALLIGSASALFSAWSLSRLKPVEISAAGLRHGKKWYPWKEIRQVYMREAPSSNILHTGNAASRIVVVEPISGAPLLFSDQSYPVSELLGGIKLYRPAE